MIKTSSSKHFVIHAIMFGYALIICGEATKKNGKVRRNCNKKRGAYQNSIDFPYPLNVL